MAQQKDNNTMDSNVKVFANTPLSGGDWKFKKHVYPKELEGSPDLSHYVVFYIAIPAKSKKGSFKQAKSNEIRKRIQNYLVDDSGNVKAGRSNFEASAQTLHENIKKGIVAAADSDLAKMVSGDGAKTLVDDINKTMEVFTPQGMVFAKEAICLYIPEALSTSYDMDWEGTSTRMSQGLIKASNEIIGTLTSDQSFLDKVGGTMKAAAGGALASIDKIGDAVGLGAVGDLMSLGSKMITNPYMEMLFKGVKNRSFEMSFKFTPKSPEEARDVHNIIKTFKKFALPEIPTEGHAQTFYIYPGEFDIVFYTVNNDKAEKNQFLARYGRSVLTSIKVDYGAAGTTAFLRPDGSTNMTGAPPAETDLSLNFTEIDLISSEMIEEDMGF